MSRGSIPSGEMSEILGNSNPGIFAFGLDVSPLLETFGLIEMPILHLSEKERALREAERIASAEQERLKKLAHEQRLLRDFFSQSSVQDVSKEQENALLNFGENFDSAKQVLLDIMKEQIAVVKNIIKEQAVFTRTEKRILNVLVDNVHQELVQNVSALQKEDNPKIFARATIATIGTLRYSVEAGKGIEGDALSREDKLITLSGILAGMLGAGFGALGGPAGIVAGMLLGAAIGFCIGKALARATASPEEKLKNQCDEYRNPSLSSIMDKHSLHAGQFGKGSMWQKPKRSTEAEIAQQGLEYHATQSFTPPF